MTECLNPQQVARYLREDCTPDEKLQVVRHLETCDVCRRRIEAKRSALEAQPLDASPVLAYEECHPEEAGEPMPEVSVAGSDRDPVQQTLGPLFEDYQILEELPRGGQAVVYKAIHKATKKKVALKILLPHLSRSARARRHFEREVELAATLDHPNIVTILDSGIAKGQYYFSMEYVRGEPLDDYLSTHALDLKRKIHLFSRVCEAMTHAHQRGVIHRDLKPSNILVDERGEPRIVDFGLAKSASPFGTGSDTVPMLSLTGEIKGTVSYMSPEQAEGRADRVDVRSDVYAMAVILYRMLTGRFPYDVSGSTVKVLQTICTVEPLRPRHIVRRFDSDIEAILMKALAKDRFQRYQSAAELQHDLGCWLQGLPIVAKSISSLYLLKKIVIRHCYGSTVLGLVLLILVGSAAISFSYFRQYKAQSQAQQEMVKLLQEKRTFIDRMSDACILAAFLESWHNDDKRQVDLATQFATSGLVGADISHAVQFLRDPSTPGDQIKVEGFRSAFAPQATWFADFCIGEAWLKEGKVEKAAQAFRASHQAFLSTQDHGKNRSGGEMIMQMLIKSRLADLYQQADRAKGSD